MTSVTHVVTLYENYAYTFSELLVLHVCVSILKILVQV
jgi:hypothetical protein